MKKIWIFILLTCFILTSCVTVEEETPSDAPPLFVTSTLPPTKQGLTLPTAVPPTASPTLDPLTPSPTTTSAASCRDSAILVEDVTIPDNTSVPRGQKFTKTWKFQNMGRCTWTGYTIAFLSGDRMSSPDSAPIPDTEARATVDVSIDLVAPPNDGAFTGIFELRNAAGDVVPIGTEKSFWVKIIVGSGASPTSSSGGAVATQKPVDITQCEYSENAGYVQQLVSLINQARADARHIPCLPMPVGVPGKRREPVNYRSLEHMPADHVRDASRPRQVHAVVRAGAVTLGLACRLLGLRNRV